jgi:CubicO group peptidase (beta-lactamase class C family)
VTSHQAIGPISQSASDTIGHGDLAAQLRRAHPAAASPGGADPGTLAAADNHYLTSGWIAAELIRRTDPAGRTLGRFFAEEVAVPLGLDFHLGLPPEVPDELTVR